MNLNSREYEVLYALLEEKTTSEIAKDLCISENTVKSHRKNIFRKMHAKNIVTVVKKCFQYGIITLNESNELMLNR